MIWIWYRYDIDIYVLTSINISIISFWKPPRCGQCIKMRQRLRQLVERRSLGSWKRLILDQLWAKHPRSGGVKRWTGGLKTVPETDIFAPKKIGRNPKRKGDRLPTKSIFRCELLVSGRVSDCFPRSILCIWWILQHGMKWLGFHPSRPPKKSKAQRKEVQRFFPSKKCSVFLGGSYFGSVSPLRLFESYNSRVWMMRLASSFFRWFLVLFFRPV